MKKKIKYEINKFAIILGNKHKSERIEKRRNKSKNNDQMIKKIRRFLLLGKKTNR